ncbi:MAG: diguanylate cyclase, partial [Candidatus Omnitrophica bacterium]|nr:diguanylate cyclase [Candidatus Omnitrophota bacterium]
MPATNDFYQGVDWGKVSRGTYPQKVVGDRNPYRLIELGKIFETGNENGDDSVSSSSSAVRITPETKIWTKELEVTVPVDDAQISGFKEWIHWNGFDAHMSYAGPVHPGFDFAAYLTNDNNVVLGLPEHTPVVAAADGVVSQILWPYGSPDLAYQCLINIDHGNTPEMMAGVAMMSRYAHVVPAVNKDQYVKKGDLIGHVYHDPGRKLPHFHFELANARGATQPRSVDPVSILFPGKKLPYAQPQGSYEFEITTSSPVVLVGRYRLTGEPDDRMTPSSSPVALVRADDKGRFVLGGVRYNVSTRFAHKTLTAEKIGEDLAHVFDAGVLIAKLYPFMQSCELVSVARTADDKGRFTYGRKRFNLGVSFAGATLVLSPLEDHWQNGFDVSRGGRRVARYDALSDRFMIYVSLFRQADDKGRFGYEGRRFNLGAAFESAPLELTPARGGWEKGFRVYYEGRPVALYNAARDFFWVLVPLERRTDDKGRFGYEGRRYNLGARWTHTDIQVIMRRNGGFSVFAAGGKVAESQDFETPSSENQPADGEDVSSPALPGLHDIYSGLREFVVLADAEVRSSRLFIAAKAFISSIGLSIKDWVIIGLVAALSILLYIYRNQWMHEAYKDGLTGVVYNRRYLDMRMSQMAQVAGSMTHFRRDDQAAILMIDLDHLKAWNTDFGHAGADKVLLAVAQVIANTIRSDDVAARYGGDEFTVILKRADKEIGRRVAQKILLGVRKISFEHLKTGERRHVSLSIGVAAYPTDGGTVQEVLKAADEAVYASKDFGRNRVTVYGEHKSRQLELPFMEKIDFDDTPQGPSSPALKGQKMTRLGPDRKWLKGYLDHTSVAQGTAVLREMRRRGNFSDKELLVLDYAIRNKAVSVDVLDAPLARQEGVHKFTVTKWFLGRKEKVRKSAGIYKRLGAAVRHGRRHEALRAGLRAALIDVIRQDFVRFVLDEAGSREVRDFIETVMDVWPRAKGSLERKAVFEFFVSHPGVTHTDGASALRMSRGNLVKRWRTLNKEFVGVAQHAGVLKALLDLLADKKEDHTVRYLCGSLGRFDGDLGPLIRRFATRLKLDGLYSGDVERLIALRLFEGRSYASLAHEFGFSEITIHRFFEGRRRGAQEPVRQQRGAIQKFMACLEDLLTEEATEHVYARLEKSGMNGRSAILADAEERGRILRKKYGFEFEAFNRTLQMLENPLVSGPSSEIAAGEEDETRGFSSPALPVRDAKVFRARPFGIKSCSALAKVVCFVLLAFHRVKEMRRTDISHLLREEIFLRLLLVPASLKAALKQREIIWVNANCLAGFYLIDPLVKALAQRYPDHQILLSSTGREGLEYARKKFDGIPVIYVPVDMPFFINRFFKDLRVRLFIMTERPGGIGPNFLDAVKKSGAKVVLYNGRSQQSENMASVIIDKVSSKEILERVDLFLVQDEEEALKLVEQGVDRDRLRVTGNVKFDTSLPSLDQAGIERLRSSLGLEPERPVIVAGSIHPEEYSCILQAFVLLRRNGSRPFLLLAPRELKDAQTALGAAARLVSDSRSARRTAMNDNAPSCGPPDIVVLDTQGELKFFYSLATVAVVGGSFAASRGGHNLLEPAGFAKPVIVGPNMDNFSSIVDIFAAAKGVLQIRWQSEAGQTKELAEMLQRLLEDAGERRLLGANALRIVQENRGAFRRSMEGIAELLPVPAPALVFDFSSPRRPVVAQPVQVRSLSSPAMPLAWKLAGSVSDIKENIHERSGTVMGLRQNVVIRLNDGRVIFVTDDHAHVYAFWWLMAQEGLLKAGRLLHIDGHADAQMFQGRRSRRIDPFDDLSATLADADDFAVNVAGLEGFIAPLAQRGLIASWHWLYNLNEGRAVR